MRVVFDLDELERELDAETREIVLELANAIVNEMKVEAPVGATGDLRRSIQIFKRDDDSVLLGTRIGYAAAVNEGRGPHTPDFDALQVWARRKLGDESAAGPVFRKIREEGTEANPYVERAIDNAVRGFSL
jgi:hypothetical protein